MGSGIQGVKGKDPFARPLGPSNPGTLFLFVFKDAAGLPVDDRYIRGPDLHFGDELLKIQPLIRERIEMNGQEIFRLDQGSGVSRLAITHVVLSAHG